MNNNIQPVEKRRSRAFLSHASRNKPIADGIYNWLTEIAGMDVWYDRYSIGGGDHFIQNLEEGIPASRSLILLHSAESVESPWVRREVEKAINHQSQYPDFRIIPVLLDDTPLEGFLSEVQGIRLPEGKLSMDVCTLLIAALSPSGARSARGYPQDLYISYGWHPQEQPAIKLIGQVFHNQRLRLIGDSPDQPKFLLTDDYAANDSVVRKEKKRQRIREIMLSCNAVLAVVPYRENGNACTSDYILEEIELAQELGLPLIIINDPRVRLDEKFKRGAAHVTELPMAAEQLKAFAAKQLDSSVEALREVMLPSPRKEHYVFFSTDLKPENVSRNRAVREVVESVTGMQCKFGRSIDGQENVYRQIIRDIRNAFVMVVDLSGRRPNILIEAGIAIGAEVHVHYVESRQAVEALAVKHPPVMLGGIQSHHYSDDVELLGHIHRLMHPYRRLILNRRFTR